MSGGFDAKLVSRCGIDCRVCVGFLGYTLSGGKSPEICGGCRTREKLCAFITNHCHKLADKDQIEYCSDCSDFPCENLKKVDKPYSEKFGVSLVENLMFIRTNGMEEFLKSEREKWKCPTCGGVICVHTKKCYTCETNKTGET
ncbi:MAG: DUF3795 domain-containing protein [Candidatus Bathyarchaeota archaeon]|nr:DUF3795 domain-containing protein [Candidatus Bathyarchaeota archaeon]